jgi:flavin-binding protein dodecin
MSIVRSIEVIAQSPQGFNQACQEAIKEASRTLRRHQFILDQERRVRGRE